MLNDDIRRDHTDQAHDGALRKVNARTQDGKGLSGSQYKNDGDLPKDIDDVPLVEKLRPQDGEDGTHDQKGNEQDDQIPGNFLSPLPQTLAFFILPRFCRRF